jgi:hypothetical protein
VNHARRAPDPARLRVARLVATLTASALLLLPASASAQETDALGNTGNVGSGAAFRPQTPRDIVESGGALVLADVSPDIAVAGIQFGEGAEDSTVLIPDALGNLGNVGSGAAFYPQTPEDILLGGGTLAWFEGIQVAGFQVDADGNVVSAPYRPYWRIVPPSTAPRD